MKKLSVLENSTACQNKWGWSTIFLNSKTTASCHRCKHYSFDKDSFMDFHNLPDKLEDRTKMLNNEWPGNGCEYCRDVEKVGGVSDRIPFTAPYPILPDEVLNDPTTNIKLNPTILEVYFNNTCNQACIYCRPRFSTVIENEVKKFGPSKFNEDYNYVNLFHNDEYDKYLEKFFEWMTNNGNSLKQFKMLGGEPLYQKEFDMLLDFFDKNPMPNLQWDIFTNLKHESDKFSIKVEKMKKLFREGKIKNIRFICSIDCWGPDVEYVRHGFDMEVAEKNINMLLCDDNISVQVHATISALSLPSMYLLGEKVKEWNSKSKIPINFHWNTIVLPTCFDIYNLGNKFVPYVDKFIETLEQPVNPQQETILGIRTRMLNSEVNVAEVKKLYGFLDELDVRRNENWKTRFPEVANILTEIINVV